MPHAATEQHDAPPFLAAGGALAEAIGRFDWRHTALGPMAEWPACLRFALGIVLRAQVPMALLWGRDGVMLYNDAYARIAGPRHPGVLGRPAGAAWPEAADFHRDVMDVVLRGGTLAFEDREFALDRGGIVEQASFDLDYSPVLDDTGKPAGVLAIVHETTEHVRAKAWLDGEQGRLRQMFEQAPGFMAMLRGPDHVFDFVNDAYARLIGHREVLGRPVRDALPEIAGQGFFEMLDDVFRSGVARSGTSLPVQLARTPGAPAELRYIDFVYQPVRDAHASVVGLFVEGSDVTDRVAAEARIRADEARSRQILDSAVDFAIIATDLDGRVTRWNEGASRMLGFAEREMLGEDIERFFTQEDVLAGVPAWERRTALESGRAADERWHLRRDGQRFWASGEMMPLKDERQAVVGFVKIVRDRTPEHDAGVALEESESRSRRAQEAGGVGVFTLDVASNTLRVTPQFCRVYGLPEQEALPATAIEALVLSDERASTEAERRTASADLDVEYRVRRANDGEVRVIARKGEFETDATGRAVRMVGVVQDVTERRAAQEALAASESQFRTFAQSVPNQVWTALPDGRSDWFNDRVYAYSGAERGALDGSGWAALVHEDDLPLATERWVAALATGLVYETEFRLRRADGAWHWHLARAVPIHASDGTIVRWIGSNTDIHARKLAEAAHAEERDRMWAMSQDLMLICDFEGVVSAVNPSAKRLLGWNDEEFVGHNLAEFLHPDDLVPTAAELDKLAGGASTLAFENRYRTKDGRWRLLDWTAVPAASRVHAIGRDITESRAIARDQERIWNVSPIVKVVVDESGAIAKINPAWSQTLGWAPHETLGRPLDAFVATGERGTASVPGAEERVVERELATRAHDGGVRRIAWNFVVENGTTFGFGRDVTAQRLAEDALRQSQKMEAVGQLTGGIAHDFNNLLQGISGSLDLTQKRLAQGRANEVDRFVRSAINAASRAAALTHRLLAFSRRQPLDPRAVRTNALVASMEDLLRRTLGERIELEMLLADDLWVTRCDPNQLESALLNIAINGRDAMPDGGKLTIETANVELDDRYAARERDVRPGPYVCLCVTDTGAGMGAETKARAFEPFYTTKPIGQGTGLGLSMVYGFARQSEGHAKIDSEPGRGTTLKLYLPRYAGDPDLDDDASPATVPEPAQAGHTVLVVEDEAVVRELIVTVLDDLAYVVIEARDGPSGLEILRSNRRIDLLITDIGLPGLNGRQVADAARLLRPALKVLFMTGYAENAALASGFLGPGMQMVTKPFAMEVFAERVRNMLEES